LNSTFARMLRVEGTDEDLDLQELILRMAKPQPRTVEAVKLWFDEESEGPDGRVTHAKLDH
jgi:hypothetical protein